jgi:hypothetical protein
LCIAWWISIFGVSATATDESDFDRGMAPAQTVYGQPIERGFFIFNSRYVSSPYVVGRQGDSVLVNDHPIPAESLGAWFRDEGPRGRRRGRPQAGQDGQSFTLARIKRQLDDHGLPSSQ